MNDMQSVLRWTYFMLEKIEQNIDSFSDQQLEELFRLQLDVLKNVNPEEMNLERFLENVQPILKYPLWNPQKYPAVMCVTRILYKRDSSTIYICLKVEKGEMYFPGVYMDCGYNVVTNSEALSRVSGDTARTSFIDKLKLHINGNKFVDYQLRHDFDEMINKIEWLRNKIQ